MATFLISSGSVKKIKGLNFKADGINYSFILMESFITSKKKYLVTHSKTFLKTPSSYSASIDLLLFTRIANLIHSTLSILIHIIHKYIPLSLTHHNKECSSPFT